MSAAPPPTSPACDREPIHALGYLQAFGGFLACDPQTMAILQTSENIETYLGHDSEALIGKPLGQVVPSLASWRPEDDTFETETAFISTHIRDGLRLFEFEPPSSINARETARTVRRLTAKVQSAVTLAELFDQVAAGLREFLGYDRVMIYRFHDDDHGEVVAEAVSYGTDSYLGLHYPAGDIPPPARRVFLENWVRMITNIDEPPHALIPPLIEATGRPTDLGATALRSPAPIHVEYLHNMGVKASLTLSIVNNGKLWGLVACHHLQSKYVEPQLRSVCETIARTLSNRVREINFSIAEEHRQRLRSLLSNATRQLKSSNDLGAALIHGTPSILDLTDSAGCGAATNLDGRWVTVGDVPSEAQLNLLVTWLEREHAFTPIFHTAQLSRAYAGAVEFQSLGSGLLAVSIPQNSRSYLLVLRPEFERTVCWAGNPEKPPLGADGRIHPRNSFAEWKDQMRGYSRPWHGWDIDSAAQIRDAIISLDLERQFAKERRARLLAEQAIATRDELIGFFAADLQRPLQSIHTTAAILAKGAAEGEIGLGIGAINRSAELMDDLIDDILNVTQLSKTRLVVPKASVNLKDVIQEVAAACKPRAKEKKIDLICSIDGPGCFSKCHRNRISRVVVTLIENSIKFTSPGGRIEASLKCGQFGTADITVTDDGPSIPPEHHTTIFDPFGDPSQNYRVGMNLHLAVAKRIVHAHAGQIWVRSGPKRGATFGFSLPIDPLEAAHLTR